MSRKTFGLNKEREVKKILLKEKGVLEVVRARGSFGKYDIIAFYEGACVLISVKSTKQKSVSYANEIRNLKESKIPFYCSKELRIWWSPHKDRKKRGWEIINIER